MFIIEPNKEHADNKFKPEYIVKHKNTNRTLGFGSEDECRAMCSALNNRFYPNIIFNSLMKDMLRNED